MLIKKSYVSLLNFKNDTDDIEININTNTGGKPADLHQQLQEEFKGIVSHIYISSRGGFRQFWWLSKENQEPKQSYRQ